MIAPVHPLEAPKIAWFFGDKKQALHLWFRLLRPPILDTNFKPISRWDIRKIPWCGWKQFWTARPF